MSFRYSYQVQELSRVTVKGRVDAIQLLMHNPIYTEKLKENNYYPFGGKHAGYNNVVSSTNTALQYKYNGKQYEEELGLNTYDFGVRNYDPWLGRWYNLDPMAEDYHSLSPYNYVANSPLVFFDPTGMWIEQVNDDGSISYIAEKGDSAWSLSQQFKFTAGQANTIVQAQHGANYIGKDGEEKSNIDPGDIIDMSIVDMSQFSDTNYEGKPEITFEDTHSLVLDFDGDGNLDSFLVGDEPVTPPDLMNSSLKPKGKSRSDELEEYAIEEGGTKILETIFGSGAGQVLSPGKLGDHSEAKRKQILKGIGIDPNSTNRQIDSITLLRLRIQYIMNNK